MGRAFPARSDCPVPSLSALAGVLVSSCKVDDPPDPIFQFPIFAQPLLNPPSFDFGCYAPSARVITHLGETTPFLDVSVSFPRSSETGQCQPLFSFNIGFPASNCPDIKASASITTLTPTASPSISFKVSKNSDTCAFDFNLQIGIPGNTCVSVQASTEDTGFDLLSDGDVFTVVEDVELTKDDSGSCTKYQLTAFTHDYMLNIDGGLDVNANAPFAFPGCCTEFQVIHSIDGFGPALGGGQQLNYTPMTIKIPQIGINTSGITPTLLVGCTPAGQVATQIFLQTDEDCDCANTIIVEFSQIALSLPAPLTSNISAGVTINCCDTINIIDGSGSEPISLSLVGCAYQLNYKLSSFNLPKTSLAGTGTGTGVNLSTGDATVLSDITGAAPGSCGSCGLVLTPTKITITTGGSTGTFSFVCPGLSCSSGHLIYQTATVSVSRGIITGIGSCA